LQLRSDTVVKYTDMLCYVSRISWTFLLFRLLLMQLFLRDRSIPCDRLTLAVSGVDPDPLQILGPKPLTRQENES